MPGVTTCGGCCKRISGYPALLGDEPIAYDGRGFAYHEACLAGPSAGLILSDRDRQLLALRSASPLRSPDRQHNTDVLPLFEAAAQPTLF